MQACRNPGILECSIQQDEILQKFLVIGRSYLQKYSISVRNYDETCLQILHTVGNLFSSIPGFLNDRHRGGEWLAWELKTTFKGIGLRWNHTSHIGTGLICFKIYRVFSVLALKLY